LQHAVVIDEREYDLLTTAETQKQSKKPFANFEMSYANHNEVLNCYCVVARVLHEEN